MAGSVWMFCSVCFVLFCSVLLCSVVVLFCSVLFFLFSRASWLLFWRGETAWLKTSVGRSTWTWQFVTFLFIVAAVVFLCLQPNIFSTCEVQHERGCTTFACWRPHCRRPVALVRVVFLPSNKKRPFVVVVGTPRNERGENVLQDRGARLHGEAEERQEIRCTGTPGERQTRRWRRAHGGWVGGGGNCVLCLFIAKYRWSYDNNIGPGTQKTTSTETLMFTVDRTSVGGRMIWEYDINVIVWIVHFVPYYTHIREEVFLNVQGFSFQRLGSATIDPNTQRAGLLSTSTHREERSFHLRGVVHPVTLRCTFVVVDSSVYHTCRRRWIIYCTYT